MRSWARPNVISSSSPLYPHLILLNVLITTFFAVFSAVSTMIAGDSIQGELGLSDTQSIWVTTLYLLGINTTVPTATWLSDHFGYKKMYAVGVFLFASSSFLVALSQGFWLISAARLLEGIGAGLIFPVGLALLTQNFSKQQLPLILSLYISTVFGAGFGIGLPMTGFIAQYTTWRVLFWIMAPCSLVGGILCAVLHEETELVEQKGSFDIWGLLTFSIFIASLLIALTLGPLKSTTSGWMTPYILCCFFLAAISFVTHILIERRHTDPLIPLVLFQNPLFAVSAIAMFLLGMSVFASISLTVDYMLHALLYEKFVTGKIAMVYGLTMAVCSIAANILIKKKVPVAFLTLLGLSLLVLSYFLNNRLDWQTGPAQVIQILCLRGIGVGLALGPITIQGITNAPKALENNAATLLTFARQVGGTYGGTLIAIISIKRTIFHAAHFSEQTNTQIPGYKNTFDKVFDHYFSDVSTGGIESAAQAYGRIAKNLSTQAYIQGQNDALIIFGYVTACIGVLIAILTLHRVWKKRQRET
ncbi:MAG: MFS transporter [Chlamydiia bacterium]|nr:MFS transporter [Chlamydiia bacterium]